ncbi:hypothetical protein TRFO_32109 [Tritrichomonas foetus]|uniref:Uncharacterized protein n=1 Tax=Tritrichomonas foetus TaxID=1144522 RepID=A0A1J4JUH5_9EUKA|nr:hypothetical protein TRFO_32109 [Tritrichomonas foetus]|eukprot:OHT01172.1 hypothetical protein TRFO_32109 [Tritrichomonas foetus]
MNENYPIFKPNCEFDFWIVIPRRDQKTSHQIKKDHTIWGVKAPIIYFNYLYKNKPSMIIGFNSLIEKKIMEKALKENSISFLEIDKEYQSQISFSQETNELHSTKNDFTEDEDFAEKFDEKIVNNIIHRRSIPKKIITNSQLLQQKDAGHVLDLYSDKKIASLQNNQTRVRTTQTNVTIPCNYTLSTSNSPKLSKRKNEDTYSSNSYLADLRQPSLANNSLTSNQLKNNLSYCNSLTSSSISSAKAKVNIVKNVVHSEFIPQKDIYYFYVQRNTGSSSVCTNNKCSLTKNKVNNIVYRNFKFKNKQTSGKFEIFTFFGYPTLEEMQQTSRTITSKKVYYIHPEFKQKKNLKYLFFLEEKNIDRKMPEITKENLFGTFKAVEIQRYFHFPGKSQIYTFVGFSTYEILGQNIQKIYNYGISQLYEITEKDYFQNQSNNSKKISYLVIKETSTIKPSNQLQNNIFGFEDVVDLQRNYRVSKYSDERSTYIGFEKIERLESAYEKSLKRNFHIISVDIPIFEEKSYLYYLYINENTYGPVSHESDISKFGVNQIADLQRNHRYDATSYLFTFFGFTSIQKRTAAYNKLKKSGYTPNYLGYSNDYFVSKSTEYNQIYYLIIYEKVQPMIISDKLKTNIFGFENVVDLQRNYRENLESERRFTYIGFSNVISFEAAYETSINKGFDIRGVDIPIFQRLNFHYLYFIEKSYGPITHERNVKLFGVYGIADLQRNCRLNKTSKLCTFMGFQTKQQRQGASKKLADYTTFFID